MLNPNFNPSSSALTCLYSSVKCVKFGSNIRGRQYVNLQNTEIQYRIQKAYTSHIQVNNFSGMDASSNPFFGYLERMIGDLYNTKSNAYRQIGQSPPMDFVKSHSKVRAKLKKLPAEKKRAPKKEDNVKLVHDAYLKKIQENDCTEKYLALRKEVVNPYSKDFDISKKLSKSPTLKRIKRVKLLCGFPGEIDNSIKYLKSQKNLKPEDKARLEAIEFLKEAIPNLRSEYAKSAANLEKTCKKRNKKSKKKRKHVKELKAINSHFKDYGKQVNRFLKKFNKDCTKFSLKKLNDLTQATFELSERVEEYMERTREDYVLAKKEVSNLARIELKVLDDTSMFVSALSNLHETPCFKEKFKKIAEKNNFKGKVGEENLMASVEMLSTDIEEDGKKFSSLIDKRTIRARKYDRMCKTLTDPKRTFVIDEKKGTIQSSSTRQQ